MSCSAIFLLARLARPTGLALLLASSLVAWGQSAPSTKKGIGLPESQGVGSVTLHALGVSWYYNWNNSTALKSSAEFVPMVFGLRSEVPHAHVLLGFNEPDNVKQANLSVQQALNAWPALVSHAKHIGTPAMAGNPLDGDWLPAFMQASPRVDFVTLHWYKGVNAERFKRDVQALCDRYKLPVWITEFAPSTAGQARENPSKYSQREVNAFIDTVLPWLENNPCVARYAWHDAKTGTSSLWNERGELTETGQRYAAVH